MINISNKTELENFALQEQIKMNEYNTCVEIFYDKKDIQDIIFHDNDNVERYCTENENNWKTFQNTLATINIRNLNMKLLDYYRKKGIID